MSVFKEKAIEVLGLHIYFLKNFNVNFDSTVSLYLEPKNELGICIEPEQAEQIARALFEDATAFLQNKWSRQRLADIFNEAIPLTDIYGSKIDWLVFMSSYSNIWLTEMHYGIPYLNEKKEVEFDSGLFGYFENTTSVMEIDGETKIIPGDRFSITEHMLKKILEEVGVESYDEIYDPDDYTEKVTKGKLEGINAQTQFLDHLRFDVPLQYTDEETPGDPQKVITFTDSEEIDTELYGDLSTIQIPDVKDASQDVHESFEEKDIAATNLNPLSYVRYTSPQLSKTEVKWFAECVQHSLNVKVTTFNYNRIARGEIRYQDKRDYAREVFAKLRRLEPKILKDTSEES